MTGYRLSTHAEVADHGALNRAIAELNRLTFGHYEGVIVPTPEFVDWYASRPGMDPALCQAAFAGEELVSSVLVTLARMRFAESMVICGIIDEVMTHPDHRRRGLAKTLIERALVAMGERGAQVSLLNTFEAIPPAGPQRLYESLGYQVYERVDRMILPPSARRAETTAERIPPDENARGAFTRGLSDRDGWLDLDEDLWGWRRIDRPIGFPCTLLHTNRGGLGALCRANLTSGGRPMECEVLSDIMLPTGDQAAAALAELVATSRSGVPLTVLCPKSDQRLRELLTKHDFEVAGTELTMLRPLTGGIAAAIARPPRSWYVAVESIIGT